MHNQQAIACPELLIFLHIPKTAGTTFHRILEQQYKPTETLSLRDSRHNVYRLPPHLRNRMRLVKGHFPYGIHHAFAQSAIYFTFMRHPVEQVISYYYYIRKMASEPLGQLVNRQQMSLEQFVNSPATRHMQNMQVHYLAGKPTKLSASAEHSPCTTDDLERARRHIADHFVLVAPAERFDESLLMLKRQLGWHNVLYAVQNANRRRPQHQQIAPRTIDVIAEANQLDLALYEEVQQRFAELVAAAGPDFAPQLATFRQRNTQAQSVSQVRSVYHRVLQNVVERTRYALPHLFTLSGCVLMWEATLQFVL